MRSTIKARLRPRLVSLPFARGDELGEMVAIGDTNDD